MTLNRHRPDRNPAPQQSQGASRYAMLIAHAIQPPEQSRRRFLATLSSASAAAFLSSSNACAQDAPPETTNVRLFKALPICWAPQYLADEFLRAEGFTNIQYVVKAPGAIRTALVAGEADFTLNYSAP